MNVGLVLAIVSALLFGGYLYALKRYFAEYPSTAFVLLTYVFAFPAYLPLVVLRDGPLLPAGHYPRAIAAMLGVTLLTVIALLAFFRAIRLGDVSYVSPIAKIVPVFVLPIEVIFLPETLSPLQVAGVLVATVAIYVANWQGTDLVAPLRRAITAPAARFALLSAATFGVVDVGKRVMMQELAIPATTYLPVLFGVVPLLVAPFALRREWPADWRGDLPKFLVAGVVVAYGNHLVMLAFGLLPASVVSPIVNAQAVVAVLLGGILLDEEYFRVRLVAAGLAVAGITMVTIG